MMTVAGRVKGHLCDSCCFLSDDYRCYPSRSVSDSMSVCVWQMDNRECVSACETHMHPLCVCMCELRPVGKSSVCLIGASV